MYTKGVRKGNWPTLINMGWIVSFIFRCCCLIWSKHIKSNFTSPLLFLNSYLRDYLIDL